MSEKLIKLLPVQQFRGREGTFKAVILPIREQLHYLRVPTFTGIHAPINKNRNKAD